MNYKSQEGDLMNKITIVSKEQHTTTQQTDENSARLTEASVVIINHSIEDVAKIIRNGNNAEVYLKNGEKFVIENFFNDQNTADNTIVFDDNSGKLYWAEFTDQQGNIADTIKLMT